MAAEPGMPIVEINLSGGIPVSCSTDYDRQHLSIGTGIANDIRDK
jgi:hypothetical protein